MTADFPRAWRALRRLLASPNDVLNALEVSYALAPDCHERGLARMLAVSEGRRVFEARPDLLAALTDRAALESLPEASLGRAYLDHIDRHHLDPTKIAMLRRETDPRFVEMDDDVRWFGDRRALMHDLWHVLSGYGADGVGEASLLPFTHGVCGGLDTAFLSVGAGVSLRVRRAVGPGWLAYLWHAWRRGRRALNLEAQPYEELLPRPLSEVRKRLGVDPPLVAHPGGIRVSPTPALEPQPAR